MSDDLAELRDLAVTYVDPGESVIDAVKVGYGGKVNLDQPGTGRGAFGAQDSVLAGEQLANRMGDAPSVGFPAAKQMALVLTAGRILIWGTGGLRGKPKNFLGEVPIAAIEGLDVQAARSSVRLQIKLHSGWEVSLEARGETAAGFGDNLRRLVEEG